MDSTQEPPRQSSLESGPFVLRELISNIPLSAEGDLQDIVINCIEFLDQNLYIGTSAAEILHFVQIPPDPADIGGQPSYILASRLPPEFHPTVATPKPGVQQILLLPSVNKACILCNWTVTFYSLPELSPVFGTTQVRGCNWIGGIDLNTRTRGNLKAQQARENAGVTILISLGKRIRVVRIGEDARALKGIDFAGSTISVRRDAFACVADARSYALLDVERQLKIPLFPISSLDDSEAGSIGGKVQDISVHTTHSLSRSTSSAIPGGPSQVTNSSHGRSTSMVSLMARNQGQAGGTAGDSGGDQLFREASPAAEKSPPRSPFPPRSSSKDPSSQDKQLPLPPSEASNVGEAAVGPPKISPVYLKPHVVSPTPEEFLLVTGTLLSEPGVGMFVNLEGDVTRSTLEFVRYPSEIIVSGRGIDTEQSSVNLDEDEEGYVLAAIVDVSDEMPLYGLEIQRWDLEPANRDTHKYWLEVPQPIRAENDTEQGLPRMPPKLGIRNVAHNGNANFTELIDALRLRRFHRPNSVVEQSQDAESMSGETEAVREKEELEFARRLGLLRSKIAVWSGDRVWWAVRNPLALQLDASLLLRGTSTHIGDELGSLNRQNIVEVINSIRGRDPKNETDFLSLGYIRQHGGLLLLISLLESNMSQDTAREQRVSEDALVEGGLDPRIIMTLIPGIAQEVVEGPAGIWAYGGIVETAEAHIRKISQAASSEVQSSRENILVFLKRFLGAWRKKRGFGSIPSENEVFRSVDAALLVVLLELDKALPRGPNRQSTIRVELNELVDQGTDCFDRAVTLLESHRRLYVLSRLYQSRKRAREVLSVWRRIIEGELDEGGEFRDGEQKVREYLTKVGNVSLIQEYGVWLAARNPKLGVQVFAEDRGRVQFEPTEVVEILRKGAPNAVKDYLEHLVFGKNHSEYVNELIAYYLDVVIEKLETSESARANLAQTYESYRALRPPKPTYRQFITENSIEEEWWHSRLRLLQLLGGSHASTAQYDIVAILDRIKPYTKELVPEVIILDGRQSHHEQALRLLTHGLGDYDTAINYCLLGGSSIYHPISGAMALETIPSREEQSMLFRFLLAEFLCIEDISNRVEQTGSLLERFGGWFDVEYVLSLIPDEWSVELVSGFLIHALRRIVRERSETMVVKALSGAENLKVNEALIDKMDKIGPMIEAD